MLVYCPSSNQVFSCAAKQCQAQQITDLTWVRMENLHFWKKFGIVSYFLRLRINIFYLTSCSRCKSFHIKSVFLQDVFPKNWNNKPLQAFGSVRWAYALSSALVWMGASKAPVDWQWILHADNGLSLQGPHFSAHALLDKGVLRIEGLDKILSSKAKRVAIVSRITCKHTFLCFVKHGLCYFTTSHQFVLFVALNVLSEQVWSMPRVSQEIVVPLASHAVCLLSCNTKVCSCAWCRQDPAVECPNSWIWKNDFCFFHLGCLQSKPKYLAKEYHNATVWKSKRWESCSMNNKNMHVPKNMMLIISWLSRLVSTCRVQNPNMPRASRYGAAHGGTAGPGSTGRRRDWSPRGKQPLLLSRRWKNDFLGVSQEART